MPRIHLTRKTRFKAALAFAKMTQTEWAELHGITPEHLNAVISETQTRESKALEEKIDAFILDVLSRVEAA